MTKTVFATCLAAAFCAAAVSAQAPAPPTPGPEQKNLSHFAGSWKIEGMMEASPFGPAGKMTGSETCRMFDGGWHLVCESTSTSPMGAMKGHALMTYDRGAKQYRYFAINNMPDADQATGTVTGNTWNWTGRMEMGGQTMHTRFVIVETSPKMHTFKVEISSDGKTWKAMMNGTSTKVGS